MAPARRLTHARVLLKADQGTGGAAWADAALAGAVFAIPIVRHSPRNDFPRFKVNNFGGSQAITISWVCINVAP